MATRKAKKAKLGFLSPFAVSCFDMERFVTGDVASKVRSASANADTLYLDHFSARPASLAATKRTRREKKLLFLSSIFLVGLLQPHRIQSFVLVPFGSPSVSGISSRQRARAFPWADTKPPWLYLAKVEPACLEQSIVGGFFTLDRTRPTNTNTENATTEGIVSLMGTKVVDSNSVDRIHSNDRSHGEFSCTEIGIPVDEPNLTKESTAILNAIMKSGGTFRRKNAFRKDTIMTRRRSGSASTTGSRPALAATSKIMSSLRNTASATTAMNASQESNTILTQEINSTSKTSNALTESVQLSRSVIREAIDEFMRSRNNSPTPSYHPTKENLNVTAAFSLFRRSIGILRDDEVMLRDGVDSKRLDSPNNILLKSCAATNQLSVRFASPVVDDEAIANLRMSVFTDFIPDLQAQFCTRSCQAISARRMRGATCIVATLPRTLDLPDDSPLLICGSVECSYHEFFGTQLGRRRLPHSILYVTEVAVNPDVRRQGIGSTLLRAVDVLAKHREVETLYLHVDVLNRGALHLYHKAGYRVVQPSEPIFLEFTTSLNLHPGATAGREHYLLYKDLVPEPIWLNDDSDEHSFERPLLGFEIPA